MPHMLTDKNHRPVNHAYSFKKIIQMIIPRILVKFLQLLKAIIYANHKI